MKKKIFTVILSITIGLTLAFIFSNSIPSKAESSEVSGGVYEFFAPFFDFIFGEGVITHGLFRKFAHMGEFFILGVQVFLLNLNLFGLKISKLLLFLPIGLLVGGLDEGIQVLSNRGASFVDVLIDFSGFTISFLIFFIIALIKRKKPNRT